MRTFTTICALLFSALLAAVPLHAQAIQKTLSLGQSEVYVFDQMTTAAVGNPLVADIVPLSSHQLMVNAKSLGVTTLFVCDHAGTHRLRLSVVPAPIDLRSTAALVQSIIGLPGVTVYAVQDTIFLEGAVSGPVAFQRASAIAGVYAPKIKNLLTLLPDKTASVSLAQTYAALLAPALSPLGVTVQVVDDKTIALSGQYASRKAAGIGTAPHKSSTDTIDLADTNVKQTAAETLPPDLLNHLIQSLPPDLKVVNLLNLGPGPTRQILVRAKIIDIDRSATKSLGLDWGTGGTSSARGGGTYTFQSQPILFGQVGAAITSYTNPLGGGGLERVSPLAAQLSALITENKARILSEPSLIGCRVSPA